jgi:hypothetical protein
LPNSAPKQEDRKIEFQESGDLVHEQAGKGGGHRRRIGQEHRQHGEQGRHQYDAHAAIGRQHQQDQRQCRDCDRHPSLLLFFWQAG